jgi:hypothetical protein
VSGAGACPRHLLGADTVAAAAVEAEDVRLDKDPGGAEVKVAPASPCAVWA